MEKVNNAGFSGKLGNPLLSVREEGVVQRIMVLSNDLKAVPLIANLLPLKSVFHVTEETPQKLAGKYLGEESWRVLARMNNPQTGNYTSVLTVDLEHRTFEVDVIEEEEEIDGLPCRSLFALVDSISDESIKEAVLKHDYYLGARSVTNTRGSDVVNLPIVSDLIKLVAVDVYPPKEEQLAKSE